jgi:hypothetical protein
MFSALLPVEPRITAVSPEKENKVVLITDCESSVTDQALSRSNLKANVKTISTAMS